MATNSGGIFIPPTKLNPLSSGFSKSSGEPDIKYTISGKKITEAKLIKKTGYCLPVVSCVRLAHRENTIDTTIAKTIAIVT